MTKKLMAKPSHKIIVTQRDSQQVRFQAAPGTNLRQALLQQGISPYTALAVR